MTSSTVERCPSTLTSAVQAAVPMYLAALEATVACLNVPEVCKEVEGYIRDVLYVRTVGPGEINEYSSELQRLKELPWETLEYIVTLVFGHFDNWGGRIGWCTGVPLGESDPIVLYRLRELAAEGRIVAPTMGALQAAAI